MKSIIDSRLVIWIIDDDLVSLFATRYGIEQWDTTCKVFDFDSGETALKVFSDTLEAGDKIPDIILLDLVMPTMNGWEFLERFEALQIDSKTTDVYILSAFTNSKDRDIAKGHPSVKGHFDKPISKEALNGVFLRK